MMILLSLIAVGLLSLSTTVLRSGQESLHQSQAQANARLALIIAIGELQKHAGPDQRVTARGDISENFNQGKHWLGVWNTTEEEGEPTWLVSDSSGNGVALGVIEGAESILFKAKTADPNDQVTVPNVSLSTDQKQNGNFAYWISDEGTKARIDIGRQSEEEREPFANDANSFARAQRELIPGLQNLNDSFAKLNDSDIPFEILLTQPTVALALDDQDIFTGYEQDLTTGGYGLAINVLEGKFKNDLSTIFDSSTSTSNYTTNYLGAKPSPIRAGQGATIFDFQTSDPNRFYFIDELTKDGQYQAGPNWGILYNFAKLGLNNRSGNTSAIVPTRPVPKADLRESDWPPYRNSKGSELGLGDEWTEDTQHLNSTVSPVFSRLQMTFALGSRPETYVDSRGRSQRGQRIQLWMKPLIGLWNPYNVKLSASSFRIDWALYPYLRIGIQPPSGGQITPRIWMREQWKGSNSNFNSTDQWFSLETPPIDFEPGESRLLSVTEAANFSSVNQLESGWGEESGWFKFDLDYSARASEGISTSNAGAPLIVPNNSQIWYGDLFLEDDQHSETIEYFGDAEVQELSEKGAAASWITLKNGSEVIHRIPDIWASTPPGTSPKFYIPEQVVSQWVRTGTTSTRQQVESLAAVPMPIGTWAFYARTTQDAAPSVSSSSGSQNTRGWVDTNPRFVVNSPLWDGSSSNSSGSIDGWFFTSPFIGGELLSGQSWNGHNGTESSIGGITNRGVPKGRGLIAEGQLGQAEPEISDFSRYSGIGGNTQLDASGQQNTILFDVPRSGLVSLGQFQHAQLSRYGYEPAYIVGNSYANIRIPDPQTEGSPVVSPDNFNDVENFQVVDTSYYTNRLLFDDYFFSTLGVDYHSMSTRGVLSQHVDFEQLSSGKTQLPNPRYEFAPFDSDESFESIFESSAENAPEAIAARLRIKGAFNINSTSVPAWKAFLSSLENLAMPQLPREGGESEWVEDLPARLPRFGTVLDTTGWTPGANDDDTFWRGFREISSEELDKLSEAIVEQVQERGPFLSLADFVNRDPYSSEASHRYAGPLQTALDQALNAELPNSVGGQTQKITNENNLFSEDYDSPSGLASQAAGAPGYVLQGDVLQALAPLMSARSDYFRIRASGEALNSAGLVVARAVCEAYVQRTPHYLDSRSDEAIVHFDDLQSETNKKFGRRFQIVSFRWLKPSEV